MALIEINLPNESIDRVFTGLNNGDSPVAQTKESKVSHIKFYLMGILAKLATKGGGTHGSFNR